MPIVVIDSDIIVDFTRGDLLAVEWLDATAVTSTLVISQMTEMELVVGSRDKRHFQQIKRTLLRFQLVSINDLISIKASELIDRYCLSHGLRIPDSIIAATAIILEAPLATNNLRDFRFIDELGLAEYP